MKPLTYVVLYLFFFLGFSPIHSQSKIVNDDISVSRNISATRYGDDGQPVVTVTLIINKNTAGGHATLEEDFSSELKATVVKNNKAAFQSNNGNATFDWINIPYDKEIVISYQLEPMNKTTDDQTVSGQFSYKNHIYPIGSSSFSLKVVNGEHKPIPKKDSSSMKNNLVNPNPSTTPEGVVYRIQIAALPDKTKVPELLKQYNITEEPYLETVGTNAIRVMIGNYASLSPAKARVEELKSKGLTGAFVAPYYNGKRTNLQEAAMHIRQ